MVAVSENGISPHGETKDELRNDLIKMSDALDKEVLDLDNLTFSNPDVS